MNNNCEKCTVLSIDSMPLGWNTIVKEDWVEDLMIKFMQKSERKKRRWVLFLIVQTLPMILDT